MIEVRPVRTRREQRQFLNFPLDLYKGNPCFVPPLWMDEKKIFDKGYVYRDTCEDECWLAFKDGKVAGRIQGILQKASNEKTGEKRIRFTRFDSIEDFEVAKALFETAEDWARKLGMDTVCGPLGYSDLEREGLLIEGFDQLSTFEEQYNAPYYPEFIERLGYTKEIDWNESQLRSPSPEDAQELRKLSEFILKRYNLHIGKSRSTGDFLRKYADGLFEVLDHSYDGLYGTVPFTDGMKKLLIDNFKLVVNPKRTAVVLDENEKVVAFAVSFASLAKAVQPSRGHLTPLALIRLLRALRRPDIIDLCLVGVEPEWLNRGVSTVFVAGMVDMLEDPRVKYLETNLNLEDNYTIQNMWKRFDRTIHKRRRSYIKKLA